MSAEPPAPRPAENKQSSSPPAPRGSSPAPKPPGFRPSRRWIIFALALLAFNFYLGSRANQPPSRVRVPYSPFFLDQVRAGHVKQITSKGTAIQGTFTQRERYAGSKPTTRFRTEIPAFADNNALSRLLQSKDVIVNAQPLDTGAPWWQNLLLGFGPTILFVFLLFWLMRRAGNVQNVLGSFGRSRARRYQPTGDRVTFADVAGIDEAKAELTEVVDFLRHPDKYRRLGGRIPHGVLLSGLPGTGKTLLARAVAGEADVPFFSMAASEFVEAIVGVGASRVRDLFTQAKEAAPAIVFIDELDAIGRSRTSGVAGFSGGNDEREQTLNQILTEMDGFDSSTSVIVIGATNRPDVLDQALLRPGRFDRRIAVQPPDRAGREAILKVHTRGVPLGPDVDLGRIAATTPGMVGADLANLVNEAALLAARRNHQVVDESDFTDALERIVLGGRAAEEVVFGETSTGAESDIQQLTEIARQMVGRWGMSSAIGPVAVIPRDGQGPFLPGAAEVSPHTQQLVDDEVRRIVDEAHQEVVSLLQLNRGKLDSLASALLEHETLDEEDAYAAAGVERATTPRADSYSAAARSRIAR